MAVETAADGLRAQYVLPLRWEHDDELDELTDYLVMIARHLPVVVVDGSPDGLFQEHARRWSEAVQHVRPAPWPGRNGKVAGVMTGLRLAREEAVVIADDDVRWRPDQLRAAVALLEHGEVVRVQNVFEPMPWHARWDTARSLVNRGLGADFPGTLLVRRSAVLRAGGYDGDVLFENLELLRTVRAGGGREIRADDLWVRRRPPTVRHFWSQRVRQAYDSLAQPARLCVEAAVLPTLVWALLRRRPGPVVALVAGVSAIAWRGRRRDRGSDVVPASSVGWAPVWLAERAVCIWVALALRATGGVPYRRQRMLRAASPTSSLRRRTTL
ncbi:glycosyltransferase [Cellulomonas fengjieae]|uniref:glycosyltransferase n=1 Tax=Cellulomonas fengjieae TaxID=2819978 RepID=UPI001AAEF70C|nr:glycosyltransferase family 2 protein [Cellulomonas fengjieae]MBO3102542.1 glycosyltransferase family 2 protein [Cellulomonas fengjieae]